MTPLRTKDRVFLCPKCGWEGTEPIVTVGIAINPPPPYAVCPKCFKSVRLKRWDDGMSYMEKRKALLLDELAELLLNQVESSGMASVVVEDVARDLERRMASLYEARHA